MAGASNETLGTNIPKKTPTQKPMVGKPPTVRIILEENDNIPPTGQFFGVNGRSYMLKPGIEVEVPQGIIDVLDNAVTSTPILDQSTKQVIGHRNRMRYPYRLVKAPVKREAAEDEL